MPYLGSWDIDDLLTFPTNTHDFTTGAATDADSAPAYRVYEDETGTAILSGTMAKLDDANTTGFYSEQITLSSGNGFESGKCYTVYIGRTVNTVLTTEVHTFQVAASVNLVQWYGATPQPLDSGNVPSHLHNGETGVITADLIAADAAYKLCDIVLRRHNSDIEASSNGDTLSLRSLYGAIAKLTNRVDFSSSPGTIYKADDASSLGTQTYGTTASISHIDSVNTV